MKKLLFFLLLIGFQLLSSQITFLPNPNHSYQPYTATLQGSGTIYYTTDGTNPDTNSPSGINAINIPITQNIVVKAMLKDSNNQFSAILTRPYYIGAIPDVTVFFKPPSTWVNSCSFRNYIQPEFTVDFFSPGNNMTVACDGWYKATFSFYKAVVNFNNCAFSGTPYPYLQEVFVTTEDTVFYDFSSGIITNPPACLLAVNDVSKNTAMVKVYPNPVQDFIKIESEIPFFSYEVVDSTGKIINKKDLKGTKIDVSDLSSGIYFIKLNSLKNESTIVKFIKK